LSDLILVASGASYHYAMALSLSVQYFLCCKHIVIGIELQKILAMSWNY